MSIFKIATYSLDIRWFTASMATMMIASVSHVYGLEAIVPYFFITSLVIFLSILVFQAIRLIVFYKDSVSELLNPEKSLYFFTFVAAINLLGGCLSKIFHFHTTASIFWYVAITFWLGISLASFSILFLYQKSQDRKIEILHGGWFFATVGTQSTAFLGIIVAEHATQYVTCIHLFSFALWSIGASLYLIIAVFIVLRLVFYPFSNDTPLSPYWMNTGAAALTALTGTVLYQHIHIVNGPFVDFLPFLKGISLFFLSVGLWWLPFLVVLAIRRHISRNDSLVFSVGYWEIAFALGICAYSTIHMVRLFGGQYLVVASVCFYISCIILWCFSSVFTVVHLARSSVWVPVNDLTINYVVPSSFKLRGSVFEVKKIVNEWLDQTVQGVLRKRYCVVINNNLTCLISYDMLAKKWYFVSDQGLIVHHAILF